MVFHNEDGNPARANIKQALGSYERPHKGVKASANSDIMYFFTSAQDGDPLQDDVRLCLGDDLKKAQDHREPEGSDDYTKVTSDSNLECDMPVNTPLPTTDVREENFDINSPLGEYVVEFLMENVDVADLPRHLVKQLFSHLVKNTSLTKIMSDEPLGDDSKFRSYDVTFSNSLFYFNDDYTLCYDNPLFDEEFEDISSLDPPKLGPLNYEPLGNPDSVSRFLETTDLNLEELTAEIGLDDLIPTEIDDGYYDSEGDILFLEHLLIEETLSDPTPAMLPKKSTLLVIPPLASKQFSLKEVERFDPFFSLTQSGGKTRVMETPSFGFHHIPSPRLAAYSPKEVMYRYYHPHLTSDDGFDPEIKKIPSYESRVHIEVLSVLWGNRQPIPDGSLPLSR
ncbi:hypothetical protein Tco_0743257 [Tanacetum coccineum]